MKTKILALLLSAFLSTSAYAGAGFPPGVLQSGAVVTGNCVKWLGNNTVADAGGFCATLSGGILPVAQGGTGAATAIAAQANLKGVYILAASAAPVSVTGTASETALATITIPAGAMGVNGAVRIWTQWSYTNSGNAKTLRTRFGGIGGTQYMSVAPTTTASMRDVPRIIQNRGAANSQVGGVISATAGFAPTTGAPVTSAIDTTLAADIVLTGTLANTGETITLESYLVELIVP